MAQEALLIVYSTHHTNTEAVAQAMAPNLSAAIVTPPEVHPNELAKYELVGFGSGIYSARHHASLLDLADRLPCVPAKSAFIFSTCGAPAFAVTREFILKNHLALRDRLLSKGYRILDEFGCVGWNTNSFLRFFGGINKGRPNAGDLHRAEEFARGLRQKLPRPWRRAGDLE
jgi:flavodoxin